MATHKPDNPLRRAWLCSLACVVVVAFVVPPPALGNPWEIWESPARLASIDAADLVVEHSSRCQDGCRYDRSNEGPEDPQTNPSPKRWLYRVGDEVVLFDEYGPGALTRFWMTTGNGVSTCIDPSIRIRFRFDGASTPQIDLSLAALFDGSHAPFTPPLVAERLASSGGYVSRVPIAYAQSLRISLSGAETETNACTGDGFGLLWYQFTAHRLPFDSAITSYDPSQDFTAWREFLDQRSEDPWNGMLAPQAFSGKLQPGTSLPMTKRSGSGWLRGIRLLVPVDQRAHIRMRIVVDDAIAVDMALTDFFANSTASIMPTRSLFFGEDAGGGLYSWWPMPHAQAISVELVADAGLLSAAMVSGSFSFDPAPVPPDAGRFRASLADRCTGDGGITVLNEQGAGKVVGFASRYRANGVADRGYLEGDERIVLDEAVAPAWYGTGIEDFFDAGFYFDGGEFSAALSGASEVDPDGLGTTAAYRIFATDPIIYTRSIRWTQETGYAPMLPVPTCVRNVVYQYQRDQPLTVSHGRFEVGDPVQAQAYAWQTSQWAVCGMQSGLFPDEPPTSREAMDCRYSLGESRFTFSPVEVSGPLRLRRTFDSAYGEPGSLASQAAAEVRVNGIKVGMFPPFQADMARRWNEQEILLSDQLQGGELEFTITPVFDSHAHGFGESAWELLGGWVDGIFFGAFDESGSRLPSQ